MQGIALGWHLGFSSDWSGDLEQIGFFRLAGQDGAAFFAARQELGEVGHDVVTFCLGGLVATGTVGL